MEIKKRHIVHLVGSLGGGGIQRLVLGLISSQALSIYRHSVICLCGQNGALAEKFFDAQIHVQNCHFLWPDKIPILPYRLGHWIRKNLLGTFPLRLEKLLKKTKADIVHTHISMYIDCQAKAVLQKTELPWVWTIHSLHDFGSETVPKWRGAVQKDFNGRLSITADSRALKDNFRARNLGEKSEIQIIHPGADLASFQNQIPRDAGWRSKWSIENQALIFGTAGRLVPVKGQDIFIEAASILKRNGVKAHFFIAGEGSQRPMLEALILEKGLQSCFHLLGFQAKPEDFLKEIDVFVLPSRSEGFPLALIEALAMGLPCIATRVGGIPEMLGTDGGLMVPPENPQALALAMRQMASDMEACRLYIRRGPQIAADFSYENCAKNFLEIYKNALRTHP